MVPLISRKLCSKKWIKEEEFDELFALAQSLPGPVAYNIALITGKTLRNYPGAFIAALGVILPPIVVIILVLYFAMNEKFKALWSFFRYAGAAIPGLIAALLFRLIKKRSWKYHRILVALSAFVLMYLFPVMIVPVFFFAVFIAFIFEKNDKAAPNQKSSKKRMI